MLFVYTALCIITTSVALEQTNAIFITVPRAEVHRAARAACTAIDRVITPALFCSSLASEETLCITVYLVCIMQRCSHRRPAALQ